MASVAPSPTQTSHVSRPPIPTGLVPVAVLLAAAVGLLALLPSLAQAVWEVPNLFLLGAVISFGVFTQRNNDAADGSGNNNAASTKDSSLAWNARHHPDDPLVVIADHHAVPSDDDDDDDGLEGARERPLSLPVRRLKPAARESETGCDVSDGFGEETDSCASSSGFWAGARAAPSPPSVLDADLDFSPCSQPQSERPFFVQHSANKSRGSNAATETPPTVPRVFVQGYHPSAPGDQLLSDDGEVTDDWDEDAADGSDEMTPVSSERSVSGDFAACASDHNDGDDTSVDEELLKLAAKAEPDGEEEVDRKADEFIAKFREQIRHQRH
ncbi:unnamed protein product [Miscanthus lutarioriparius]|uniref:Uncharacterized protein n=1 Tax=Miscanthus lutarioriparius TaxID=422564 RepID=A0A811PKD5_9POAL|nr:unnamed protein product [Miscanthus lutarioriparius]